MQDDLLKMEVAVGSDFPKKAIPLIESARESIKIIVFDWRWYPNDIGSVCQRFNQAIITAQQKNVKVQVLTNGSSVINLLNNNKIQAKKTHSKKLLHTKLMLIDDKVVVVGSHNYTQSAFTKNQELSVILSGKGCLDRFVKYFEILWQS